MQGISLYSTTQQRGEVVARYDEKLEQENRDLKEIIREELPRRESHLEMIDGFDEVLVNETLAYLSGSQMRSVTRTFIRVMTTNSLDRRARGQLAVICELFEAYSTHIDQGRLLALQERVKFFVGITLVEDHARARTSI